MNKISYQIAWLTILCMLITGIAVGALAIYHSGQIVSEMVEQNMISQAEKYAQGLEKLTAQTEMMVHDANTLVAYKAETTNLQTSLPEFTQYATDVVRQMAGNVSFNTDFFVVLGPQYAKQGKLINLLYLRDGDNFVFADLPWMVADMDKNPDEFRWFTEPIKRKKGYWTDVYYDPNIKRWMISYIEPIITKQGMIGVAGMDINFEALKAVISQVHFFNTGYAVLIDRNQTVIYHPIFKEAADFKMVENGQMREVANFLATQHKGVVSYTLNGKEKIAGFAPVGTNFTLLTVVEKNDVMGVVQQLRNRIIMVVAAVMLLLVFLALSLGRKVSKPIELAAEHALQIAGGDFSANLPTQVTTRHDEIGVLGKTLMTMTANLQAMMDERDQAVSDLEKVNESLELRVLDRTLELEALNEELLCTNDDVVQANQSLLHEMEIRLQMEDTLQTLNSKLQDTLASLVKTQEELARAEKISAMTQLVTGLAHEINTPLGICITSSSYLSKILEEFKEALAAGNLSKQQYENFADDTAEVTKLIENNLNSAVKLINHLKMISGIKNMEHQAAFNIFEILSDAVGDSQKKLTGQQTISLQCPPTLEFDGNPQALFLVISRLISNAITHGFENSEDGMIEIEVSEQATGHQIICNDNGSGIAAEHIGKVFDPFFTTKRGKGNIGLGMYIVYQIMTLHFGGTVVCESSAGKGTKVTLYFPHSPELT